jgi:membrane-bound metal-dependent hydrolase YbcI (DUF457 family)
MLQEGKGEEEEKCGMASTIGHSLAGVCLYQWWKSQEPTKSGIAKRSTLLWCVGLANLPDLDLLPGLLYYGDPHRLHSGITHTLLFTVGTALLMAGIRVFGTFIYTFWLSFLLLLSHLTLDYFSGKNLGFAAGYGVMFLYPFSAERVSAPFKLFMGPRHAALSALLSRENITQVAT